MHASHAPAHHVGTGHILVVHWAELSAHLARVGIFDVTTVRRTVVPIFVMLEGSGCTWGLLCARPAKTIPGWLLVASAVSAATSTSASSSACVRRAWVLRGGVYVAWGLLANGHAELLDVRQKLALHCGQAGGLALDRFLGGHIHGARVCQYLAVQRN